MKYIDYFTAIIICEIDGKIEAKKFHNIRWAKIPVFERFARMKFKGAHHINFYGKYTRQFEFRKYL